MARVNGQFSLNGAYVNGFGHIKVFDIPEVTLSHERRLAFGRLKQTRAFCGLKLFSGHERDMDGDAVRRRVPGLEPFGSFPRASGGKMARLGALPGRSAIKHRLPHRRNKCFARPLQHHFHPDV